MGATSEQLSQETQESEKQTQDKAEVRVLSARSQLHIRNRTLDGLLKEQDESSSRIELIQNSKFAILLSTEVIELKEKATAQCEAIDKKVLSLPLYMGDITGVQIEGLYIPFKVPTL